MNYCTTVNDCNLRATNDGNVIKGQNLTVHTNWPNSKRFLVVVLLAKAVTCAKITWETLLVRICRPRVNYVSAGMSHLDRNAIVGYHRCIKTVGREPSRYRPYSMYLHLLARYIIPS